MVRSGARPANLADLREVLPQEVLKDIHGSLGQCDSPQCGGNASAKLLGDVAAVTAMLDRILHHCSSVVRGVGAPRWRWHLPATRSDGRSIY